MANNKRIAGITIEIGGDTTNLQKSLKGVDSQLSKTQSNLKDINKLLKLDPGNTELLTQKQQELTKALDNTRKRLEKLKDAQKEALSKEQYDALQREIIETEQNLQSLENEYKEFGSVGAQQLKAVGNKVKEVGGKITNVGKTLTTHVTAPIVAMGVASYAAFNEVDGGMDIIIKKTGATGEALDDMGKIMEDIATSIPTDFETAGTAIGEVNTRFGVTGDKLRELSAQYIRFAEINDTDVNSAIDTTQKALTAFGLSADDAGTYLNYLTSVSQRTGADVASLSNTVLSNSAAFKDMGLSLYDATELMGQLEMSGADSTTVMNGLSKALKTATDKGIPLDKALGDLQRSIENGTGATDGLTLAYKYFGKSGAQVYEAVKSGAIDFNNLSVAADNMGDVVTDTFNATLDPADSFQTSMNAIKLTGASIAEAVMPALSAALGKVRDIVVALKERWDGLSDGAKKMILIIAGVVASIGPLIMGIGGLITTIGNAITAISTIKTVISAMSPATQALSLKVMAIGAIVAAVAAIIIANWDDIKKFWDDKLKPVFEQIKQVVVEKVVPAVQKAWEKLQPVIKKVFDAIKGFWEKTLKPAITDLWKVITEKVVPAVKKAWENLQPIVTGFFTAVKNAWTNVLSPALSTMYTFIVDTLVPKIQSAWEALQPVFETVFNAVKTAWDTVGKPVMETVQEVFGTYIEMLKGYFSGLIEFISGVFTGDWKRAWNGIKNAFGAVFKGLKDLIKKPINAVIDFLNKMISSVENAINGVISAINSKVRIKLDPITVFGATVFPGIDWGPNLKKVNMGRIKKLYTGGVLGEGERATVGEFAPEYLTVRNGQAVVTPIPGAARYGSTVNNTINVYAQPGQSVTEIAHAVERIMIRQTEQTGAAYA